MAQALHKMGAAAQLKSQRSVLAYSVIIPVHNEAAVLARSAAALRAATAGQDAQIIYVLNGTTDASADVISGIWGDGAEVEHVQEASKTGALTAGDTQARHFPRVYLDADICVKPGDLERLLGPIVSGQADLTAAPIQPETEHCNWMAREVARIWASLPYAKRAAFQCLICVSAAGRGHWGDWPDLIADDLFVAASIPGDRKMICAGGVTDMPVPGTLAAWIGVRARWIRGQEEFETRWPGKLPKGDGQRKALAGLLKSPRNWVGVALYLSVWVLARHKARLAPKVRWFRDETTRSGT